MRERVAHVFDVGAGSAGPLTHVLQGLGERDPAAGHPTVDVDLQVQDDAGRSAGV